MQAYYLACYFPLLEGLIEEFLGKRNTARIVKEDYAFLRLFLMRPNFKSRGELSKRIDDLEEIAIRYRDVLGERKSDAAFDVVEGLRELLPNVPREAGKNGLKG